MRARHAFSILASQQDPDSVPSHFCSELYLTAFETADRAVASSHSHRRVLGLTYVSGAMRGTTAVLRTVSACTSAWTSQGPQSIARVKSRPRAAPAILAAWHLRGYQHSSEHAPATSLRSAGGDDGSGDDATYSRWSLMSAWHRAARQLTPAEVAWEERDTVDVQREFWDNMRHIDTR